MGRVRLSGGTLAERIDEACQLAGINTTQLAAKTGVTFAAAARWRKGRADPRGEHLRTIAEVTGVTVDELLGIYDGNEPPFEAWEELQATPIWETLDPKQRKFLAALPWPNGVKPTLAAYLLAAQAIKSAGTPKA